MKRLPGLMRLDDADYFSHFTETSRKSELTDKILSSKIVQTGISETPYDIITHYKIIHKLRFYDAEVDIRCSSGKPTQPGPRDCTARATIANSIRLEYLFYPQGNRNDPKFWFPPAIVLQEPGDFIDLDIRVREFLKDLLNQWCSRQLGFGNELVQLSKRGAKMFTLDDGQYTQLLFDVAYKLGISAAPYGQLTWIEIDHLYDQK